MPEKIVIKTDFDRFDQWLEQFARHNIEAIRWEDRADHIDDLRYGLVWHPGTGELDKLVNLEVVFSIGAGIDHLKGENMVPAGLPVVRMVEASLTTGMIEYTLYMVLRFHREMHIYDQEQRQAIWNPRVQLAAAERTVGILGMGVLGGGAAEALNRLGFNVIGWSRSEKQLDGVRSYFGDDQLTDFLGQTDILVSLLPLTDATRGLINKDFINKLPRGAFIVNAGRGPVLVEDDLLASLDAGHIAGAGLDVFETEPLPADHPIWRHPAITVTPHVASATLPGTSVEHVVNNINLNKRGEPLTHWADLQRGY